MTDSARASLWLELKFDGETRVFELTFGSDRKIRVGSLLAADFPVARAGVKAVHVQFERFGHYVLLRPPLRSDVRVSGEPLVQPRALVGQQWVEFCGVRLSARVLETPPTPAVVPPPSIQTPDPMITFQRPDDEDTEVTAIIPPPATRDLAVARPSSPSQPPALTSAVATSPPPPERTPIDGARRVVLRRPREALAEPSSSELPAMRGSRALQRLASITVASVLVILGLLAILRVAHK